MHEPFKAVAAEPGTTRILEEARSATLATISPSGQPRLVPICFATVPAAGPGLDPADSLALRIYSPLDQKRKRSAEPRDLARVRDIAADPRVSLLVDRWSEDWSTLGWLRLEGVAIVLEPEAGGAEHRAAVTALRERYPQYLRHELESRPLIRITPIRVTSWMATERLSEVSEDPS